MWHSASVTNDKLIPVQHLVSCSSSSVAAQWEAVQNDNFSWPKKKEKSISMASLEEPWVDTGFLHQGYDFNYDMTRDVAAELMAVRTTE